MNPNLPVGGSAFDLAIGTREALPQDVTQLAFSLHYASFRRTFTGNDRVDDDGDARLDSISGALAVRHFFGEGFSADLLLPVGYIAYEPSAGTIGRLSGLGDLNLGGRYDFSALWGPGGYRPSLTLRLGLGLPTGRQDEVSFEDLPSDLPSNLPPNLLSIGNAAWSVSGRLSLTQFLARWVALELSSSIMQPVSRTENGLRFGTLVDYGLGALFLPVSSLSTWARISGEFRARSDEEAEGSILQSGGNWLYAELGVGWMASERLTVTAGGRVPFFVDVNGTQIAESYSLTAGLILSFGGQDEAEDEHDHGDGHEHGVGDDHDEEHPTVPAGPSTRSSSVAADVRDLRTGGESFAMRDAQIYGKYVVVDFWAEWCAPCHELDRMLRRLASAHEVLAVRRVEVPDFDCPVAKEHLANSKGLPVLWVIAPSGALVDVIEGVHPHEAIDRIAEHLE